MIEIEELKYLEDMVKEGNLVNLEEEIKRLKQKKKEEIEREKAKEMEAEAMLW